MTNVHVEVGRNINSVVENSMDYGLAVKSEDGNVTVLSPKNVNV